MKASYFVSLVSLVLLTLIMGTPARAYNIGELLDAAARQPAVALSELASREARLQKDKSTAALYPKINLFGKAEAYNSPTNLRPMPPTEVNVAAGDSLPFSRTIGRYGINLNLPLYVQPLFALQEKMKLLSEKARISQRITVISRKASVVALNSAFQYLVDLDAAIDARLKSLTKTREDVSIKVRNGRSPETELIKLNNLMLELKQQKNALAIKILNIQRDIQRLTDLSVKQPVAMVRAAKITTAGGFIEVNRDEKEVAAAKKEVERRRSAKYPSLILQGTISDNVGEAYNTDDEISRSYNFAILTLNFPLFDKTLSVDENIARLQLKKSRQKLANTIIELKALANNLKDRQPVVAKSIELARQAVSNDNHLLAVAKIAYKSGRTTTEEYLRYETQVLSAEAALHKAIDDQWQITVKQAVLYGIDIEGVVK